MRSALAQALRSLQAVAGVWMTYRRGDLVAPLRLVPCTRPRSEAGGPIVQILADERDFIALVDELALDGRRTLPQPGDRIEEADGDTVHVYEAQARDGEADCWTWHDPRRVAVRIHTRLVKEF